MKVRMWVLLLSFSLSLYSAEKDLLKISEIQNVMNEIFSQHVSKKEMTPEIIQRAFQEYINEFDPERIYLLESEVNPYFTLHRDEATTILNDYKNNDFSTFLKLNKLIEKSIYRARNYREEIKKDPEPIFLASLKPLQEIVLDPKAYQPFPQTEKELRQKIHNDIIKYIQYGQTQVGLPTIFSNQGKVLDLYENNLKPIEDSYLGLDDEGKPLSQKEKDNFFSIHVLKALASTLDAHTKVFSNREAFDMKSRLEKEIVSVGISVKKENGKVLVTAVEERSSADEKGLKISDEITKINDIEVKNKSIDEIIDLLNNGNGNSVSVTLIQNGRTVNVNLEKSLKGIDEGRVEVSFEKVDDGLIGKIALHSFYQNDEGVSSEKDMRKAIKQLKSKGNLKGLILDLRDNMGGFLNQAVKVTGLFIKTGIVVISKYANGEERYFRDVDGNRAYEGPLIILTSKETASAAEIVAESLRDYGVALIVGDAETYGKGTIQSQNVTEESVGSFFKVTVGKYYTISGNTPQMRGVKIDLVVPSSVSQERIGERYLENPIPADTIASNYQDDLKDISFPLRAWYQKNYLPKLQEKEEKWQKMVPILKERSHARIAKNKVLTDRLEGDEDTFDEPPGEFHSNDIQMEEAVNIMKDMIEFQS